MMTSGILNIEIYCHKSMPMRKCLAGQGPKHSQTFEPDVGLTSTGQEPNWTEQ